MRAPSLTHPRAIARLPARIQACLFDMDGVLTDTATVHSVAWKQTFDAFLRCRGQPFRPFDAADYEQHVDGRPRIDGVRSFLASRGIRVSDGAAARLADGTSQTLLRRIREQGVRAYPGSVRFVHAVRDAGLRTAVVTSSSKCREVLAATGLADLFDARVDGTTIERCHLAGKPAPDSFLAAARQLGTEPAAAAVFEDALAGVAAGRSGGFGYVVGVDRAGQAAALRRHGADLVVPDLANLLAPA